MVPHGLACIQATFNNTIVTITAPDGRVGLLVFGGFHRLQGLAQGHSLRRAAGFHDCRLGGARSVRHEESIEVRVKGPGSGRESAVRALASAGLAHRAYQGRDAGSS